jgi:hypothetical protein
VFWRWNPMPLEGSMMILRAVWILSAVVCAAAPAQTCSGGAAGGADATGNQCSAPGVDVDAAPPVLALVRPPVAIPAPAPAVARPTGSRSAGALAQAPIAAAHGRGLDRFPVKAKPPSEPLHTAKIEKPQDSECSGGAEGGMDATGNQCNVAGSTESVLVSKVH